jgi:hypothetical protein
VAAHRFQKKKDENSKNREFFLSFDPLYAQSRTASAAPPRIIIIIIMIILPTYHENQSFVNAICIHGRPVLYFYSATTFPMLLLIAFLRPLPRKSSLHIHLNTDPVAFFVTALHGDAKHGMAKHLYIVWPYNDDGWRCHAAAHCPCTVTLHQTAFGP